MKKISAARWIGSAALATWLMAAYPACALTPEEAELEAAIPSPATLELLEGSIREQPNNLDHYFAYAMLAKKMEDFEKAAWAMENMLRLNPTLPRIKLELGLIYIEMERFDEARQLFTEVLESNPPAEVRSNVETVLAALDKRSKTHHTNVALLTGLNSDSNANGAPSSGNITIVDTTIPLGNGAGSKEDIHAFAAISANHSYDIDVSRKRPSWRWKSSALAYQTEQDTLDTLNVQLYSVKTGPEITLNDLPLQAYMGVGYQHIGLDRESYLRNPQLEGSLNFLAQEDLILSYNYMWEFRDYMNSYTNTTFESRSGRAFQHSLGVKHILSPRDMFGYTLLMRDENARELYYANDQVALLLNYTRVLTEQAFLTLSAGYRNTQYILPDTLISANERQDDEYSMGLTAGYRFASNYVGDFTVSGGYQFRDVNSSIQNYEYDNHRVSLSMAKEFDY